MHFLPDPMSGAKRYSVVMHSGSFGVVLDLEPLTVALIHRQYEPRSRGDVPIDEISDLAQMALPGGSYLVKAGTPVRWTRGVVVGMCAPAMRREIERASRHAAESEFYEDKYAEPLSW